MTPEELIIQSRLHRAREVLSSRYGNLYGIKLKRWFTFNGQTAVIVGDTAAERRANLLRFEERLASYRNSKGTSALHRARRNAASGLTRQGQTAVTAVSETPSDSANITSSTEV